MNSFKVNAILLIVFIVSLPLIFVQSVLDPVLLPRQLSLTIFCFLTLVVNVYWFQKFIATASSFFKHSVFFIFIALWVLAIILSYFVALNSTESLFIISKYCIGICFLIIISVLLVNNKITIEIISKSVCAFTLFVIGFAISDIYVQYSLPIFDIFSVQSTIAHKNLLSSILFLGLPFLVFTINYKWYWKLLSILTSLLALIIITIIQTRAVWLALIIAVPTFIIITIFSLKKIKHRLFLLITISFLIIISCVLYLYVFPNCTHFSHATSNASLSERIMIWENTLKMIHEHLFLGVGVGNWQIFFPKYGVDNFFWNGNNQVALGTLTFQRPHNDYLWIFSETGILGILAYLGAFITLLFYNIKLILVTKVLNFKIFYILIFAIIIGYTAISFFDFPLERIEHQILLYLLFAIIFASYYKQINVFTNKLNRISIIVAIFLVLVISVSAIVSVNRIKSEYHTRKMLEYHITNNLSGIISEGNLAKSTYYNIDAMSMPTDWYIGVGWFSLNNIKQAAINFENAYTIHPYNIHVINNLASCNELLGNRQIAINLYTKALQISPNFTESLLNLSAVYFNLKMYNQAFTTINKCPVNTADSKYNTFIIPILKGYIKYLVEIKELKQITANKYLNSNQLLLATYNNAKNNNEEFKFHIKNK